jgi:hypothetical protein
MKIVDNWHAILLRAWSIRIAILWIIVSVCYSTLPAFYGLLSADTFALLSIITSFLFIIARIIKQFDSNGASQNADRSEDLY